MSKLEDLKPNASVSGILPDSLVTVVSVQWFGSEAIELTFKSPSGRVANELLYIKGSSLLLTLSSRWTGHANGFK